MKGIRNYTVPRRLRCRQDSPNFAVTELIFFFLLKKINPTFLTLTSSISLFISTYKNPTHIHTHRAAEKISYPFIYLIFVCVYSSNSAFISSPLPLPYFSRIKVFFDLLIYFFFFFVFLKSQN